MNNNNCSLCGSENLIEFSNFGKVALAGSFLKEKNFNIEKKYVLRMGFCKLCLGVQIIDHIDPNILFKNYFYSSSNIQTLNDHFINLANEINDDFIIDKINDVVIEFGCNDGVLLRPLNKLGIKNIIGIDPAENIVAKINISGVNIINDYFNKKTTKEILNKFGKIKVILANNVFAHISEIRESASCVSSLLSDDGVFIFEVHYLGKIIEELQYDFIYHEHLYYHSLTSLTNFLSSNNLMIFDVKFIDIHAGSIRVYTSKKNIDYPKKISKNVKRLLHAENQKNYHKVETFKRLNSDIKKHNEELIMLLKKLKSEGKTVYGYGASGRANTIIQLSGIDKDLLPFIIDDAQEKHNFFTPGSHIPIISSEILHSETPPDYVLLFAWSFKKEIIDKNKKFIEKGGKFIVPLPKIHIVNT